MKRQLIILYILLGVVAASSAFAVVSVTISQHHQNDALRSIMCRAVRVVRRTPVSAQFTVEEKHKALRFYTHALSAAHLKPCE